MAGARLHAGMMVERVVFQRRTAIPDGAGNTEDDWDLADGFERQAGYIMKPGSEAVLAARLEGRQPLTAFVRFDTETAAIVPGEFRMVDKRDGTVFAIRAAADMDRRREWITIVCESGVQA